jgi:hypothetical protein
MGYPSMVRRFTGSSTSTGSVTLKQYDVGFSVDNGSTSVYVADTPLTTWDIQIGGAATVTIQGNEGNPDTAGDWYDISTVTASGVVKDDRHTTFTRVKVDSYTSGSVNVRLAASEA